MSERYSRLFALPENLYAEGAPLVIAAGALLKDNQTGKVLAQLKFRSISPKEIKAVKVKITPLDTVYNPLGGEAAHQYLDLTARRGDEFGQKSPVALPNAATRAFSAEVCEVAFADNTLWQAKGEPWEELKKPVSISTAISDQELRKQVRLEYGNSFEYIPTNDKDLWICACGELNRKGEHTCARCRQELSRLLELDMEALKAKRDAHLAAEKVQAEKDTAQAKAKAKRNTKLAVIITPIVVVAIVAAVLISGFVKKNNAYQDAVALLNAGEFDKAISAFEALGDYKDSKQQIETTQLSIAYNEAVGLSEEGEYTQAIQTIEALIQFQDCPLYIEKVKSDIYERATRFMESKKYDNAYTALTALENYKDSQALASDFVLKLVAKEEDRGPSAYRFDNILAEFNYDEQGNIVIPESITVGYDTLYFDYSEDGALTKKTEHHKDDFNEWNRMSTYTYSYNTDGSIQQREETQKLIVSDAGSETEEKLYYTATVSVRYNSNGQIVERVEDGNYFGSGGRKLGYRSIVAYQYDSQGLLLSSKEEVSDSRYSSGTPDKYTRNATYGFAYDYLPGATATVDYQILIMNGLL